MGVMSEKICFLKGNYFTAALFTLLQGLPLGFFFSLIFKPRAGKALAIDSIDHA